MVEIKDIVITGLTVFTLTYMLHALDGPFDIFSKLRESFGVHFTDEYVYNDRFFSKLFVCFWCLSTWVAIPVCIVYVALYPSSWWNILFLIPASIAVAGIVYEIVT